MTRTAGTVNIHRALDEAFAAAPAGPDAQDLKEEVRASLLARVADLEAGGVPAGEAARAALAELGDLREVVATVAPVRRDAGDVGSTADAGQALHAAHRVRPAPAFVLRATAAGVVLAGCAALLVMLAAGLLVWPAAAGAGVALLAAVVTLALVTDALRQETTSSYPLPATRAAAFGGASAATAAALGLGALLAADPGNRAGAVVAGVLLVVGVAAFVVLGVTQTNRHKPWTLELGRQTAAANRFDQDPAAAARFGIYSAALGLVAIIGFVVLTFTVGLAWSWLALAVVVPVYFLMLARMLFPATRD
jgi:MFS family permease